MGIQGLLPYVDKACRPCKISEFQGRTIAVDACCWLHKGAFGCAPELARGLQTDFYVTYCLKFVKSLLSHGIKVILVFDGASLPAKKQTNETRKQRRVLNREKGLRSLANGDHNEANNYFRQSMNITQEMVSDVIAACRALRRSDVSCIVAPYESDAQLAYLNLNGFADIVLSEDSDLILFGCKKIIFKSDQYQGVLYDLDQLPSVFEKYRPPLDFTTFRRACILSGCDYSSGLTGFGLSTATKFFRKTISSSKRDIKACLKRIPMIMNMKSVKVTEEYVEQFLVAENTFLYQLVFDPKQRRLLPLNPYPDGLNAEDMPYAGKLVDENLAIEVALGNLCPHTYRSRGKLGRSGHTSLDLPVVKQRSPKKSPMKAITKTPKKTAFETGHVRNVIRSRNSPRKSVSLRSPEKSSTVAIYESTTTQTLTRSRYFTLTSVDASKPDANVSLTPLRTSGSKAPPAKSQLSFNASRPISALRKRSLFEDIVDDYDDKDEQESEESGFYDSPSTPTSSSGLTQSAKKMALTRKYSFRSASQEVTQVGVSPLLSSFSGMCSQFQYYPKNSASQGTK